MRKHALRSSSLLRYRLSATPSSPLLASVLSVITEKRTITRRQYSTTRATEAAIDKEEEEDVTVIGAGIVGLASAFLLAKSGRKVTVLDRHPHACAGSSFANGGLLCPAHAVPLANRATILKTIKSLLSINAEKRKYSPFKLTFSPLFERRLWRWLIPFLTNSMSEARVQHNTQYLTKLALVSMKALHDNSDKNILQHASLAANNDDTRSFAIRLENIDHSRGILNVYWTEADVEQARLLAREMHDLGVDSVSVLTPEECAKLEPALAHSKDKIAGGLYTGGDEVVDTRKLALELEAACKRLGVRFEYGKDVIGIDVVNVKTHNNAGGSLVIKSVSGLKLRDGSIHRAKNFVLCGGCNSTEMLHKFLGLKPLPIYPIKGYSVTISRTDQAPIGTARTSALTAATGLFPKVALFDTSAKIVVTPLNGRLRLAGIAEIAGSDMSIHPLRVDSLVSGIKKLIPHLDHTSPPNTVEVWCGFRPATPDGLPVVSICPQYSNLFLNFGHGHLGSTLAFGSAKILTEVLLPKKNYNDKMASFVGGGQEPEPNKDHAVMMVDETLVTLSEKLTAQRFTASFSSSHCGRPS